MSYNNNKFMITIFMIMIVIAFNAPPTIDPNVAFSVNCTYNLKASTAKVATTTIETCYCHFKRYDTTTTTPINGRAEKILALCNLAG
jgi:hypothetical protein